VAADHEQNVEQQVVSEEALEYWIENLLENLKSSSLISYCYYD
jgi:hypothetical protein